MIRSRTRLLLALLMLSFPLWTACSSGERVGDGILKPQDAGVTYDTTRPDIGDQRGVFGDPCDTDASCQSGLCLPAAAGGVCSSACTDSCDPGYACLPATSGDGNACWPLTAVACQPCAADAECQVGGQTGNRCVSYGANGSFCGLACEGAGTCPDGFSCDDDGQCVAASGQCECNAAGILAGASTACTLDNEHGSCVGVRQCKSSGLTRCIGPEPAAETCDGRDEDCDGDTDEGTDGQPCELTNEFGTCIGVIECRTGDPLCVGRVPSAEICNGVDDDCDGETDEGQPDLDEDGIKDCVDDDIDGDGSLNVDDCAPRNPAIFPAQTEVCNGIDDNCNLQVDEGVDDNASQECGHYICAGLVGCRTDCLQDRHCISGFLCDLADENDNGNARECLPSVCGNGELEIREVCDDGTNDGGYGGCLPGCGGLGPRCGDGVRQPDHEVCDDGALNNTPNHCNMTCTGPTPPQCNNGVLEAGEGCDLGAANSNAPNAACRLDCSVRRCGDGVVDGGFEEACDAGVTANGQTVCGCQASCQFAVATVACRAAAGPCDTAESCNGAGACPADGFLTGVTCRGAAGVCDAVEVCSGAGAACPADVRSGASTVCRASGGGCDPAEVCDGQAVGCPADVVRPAQFTCRAANGLCDAAEVCDGQARACPNDGYLSGEVRCRVADGACDAEEWCTGSSPACPADVARPPQAVCREAAGGCDAAEVCDGTLKSCPADVLRPAEAICNPSVGACDPAELCDGLSAACPADVVADAGTVCNPSTGSCDPAELCDGTSGACPEDYSAPDLTPCSAGQGDCVFEPCLCFTGECQQLCGNGTVESFDDNSTLLRAPGLLGEVCDAGEMNGARDGCSLACDGLCDADFGWVVEAGGTDQEGGNGVAVDEQGASIAVGEFRAGVGNGPPAVFGGESYYSTTYSSDFWVMAQDTDANPLWAACGGGSFDDVAHGVDTDDEGSVYVAGRFGGSATVDCCDTGAGAPLHLAVLPGSECAHTLDAVGGGSDYEDIFLAKWTSAGTVAWAVSAGSWGDDSAEDVATDSLGRSVVVGYHSGSLFNPTRFGDVDLWGSGYRDIFVAKYDKNGNAMWAHGGGRENSNQVAQGVALDGASNIYVTGYFDRSFTWDDNATAFDSNSEGTTLFLLGMTPDGDLNWVLTADTQYGEVEGTSVAVDGQGGVYVTGHFASDYADFGNLRAQGEGSYDADMFVAKAQDGEWQWVAVATDAGVGWDSDEVGFGVAVDRSGAVFVTGEFNGHIEFGPFAFDSACGSNCMPAAPGLPQGAASFYGGDGFVAKLSPEGDWLWAKTFGSGDTNTARDIGLDPKGRIYVTGAFTGPAAFDALMVDGFNGSELPMAPGFSWGQDAFVAKMIPDGGPRCFDCGDGVVDPGESCDDDDALDHCVGACDGICYGPANSCGDGWDECDEDYDLGANLDQPDLGMCMIPTGNLWCFQTASDTFTYEPVEPGVPAALGPGVKEEVPLEGFGGNPTQHPDCPVCNPVDANVDCRSGSARQWGGDGPPLTVGSTARSVCDGDPGTPPCSTAEMGCSGTATNDEAAALECGDYYVFRANTGDQVAFEFDDLTKTQGPTGWSLWVSLSGADGSFEKVASGPTTRTANSDFGGGIPTPMHVVVLTDYVTARGPIKGQLDVHFRLYGWGATATDQAWTVDNVRVGEPTFSPDFSGLVSHWPGEYSAADAVDGNDGAWGGGEAYDVAAAHCAGFLFDADASHRVAIGDPENLRLGQVSVSAWFRRDDNSTASDGLEGLVEKWDNVALNKAEYALSIRDNKVSFAVSTAGDLASYRELSGGPAIVNGRWYHAVGTYDGAALRLYIDGSPVGSLAYAGGPIVASGATLELGAIHEAVDRAPFRGALDEVMIFGGALSQTSVSALYFGQRAVTTCAGPPVVQPSTVVWCFDDPTGATFITTPTVDLDTLAPSAFSYGAGVTGQSNVGGNASSAVRPAECAQVAGKAATGTGWPVAAVRGVGNYYAFAVNAPAGAYTLSFEVLRSGTGPTSFEVESQLTGPLGSWSIGDVSTWSVFSWSGNLSGGADEIRVYAYASESTAGTLRIDNFALRPAP